MKNKVVSAAEAIAIIRDGDTIAFSGFVGTGTPDELIVALEKRFVETGHPRDLTLVFAAAPGDGKEKGLNRLAHEGLVKRVVGGHWNLAPKLGKLALEGAIEAYNFPQGVDGRTLPRGRIDPAQTGRHSRTCDLPLLRRSPRDPRGQGGRQAPGYSLRRRALIGHHKRIP